MIDALSHRASVLPGTWVSRGILMLSAPEWCFLSLPAQ